MFAEALKVPIEVLYNVSININIYTHSQKRYIRFHILLFKDFLHISQEKLYCLYLVAITVYLSYDVIINKRPQKFQFVTAIFLFCY